MYLLLLPIIGLFSMLSVYGDDTGSLSGKIDPYLLLQKINLTIDADTQLDVTYVRLEYDKKQGKWGTPTLIFSLPVQTGRIEFLKNEREFDNCYLNFKRSFSAICFDAAAVFLFMAFYALYKSEKSAFIVLMILSVSLTAVCLLTLVLIKKRIRKKQTEFFNGCC